MLLMNPLLSYCTRTRTRTIGIPYVQVWCLSYAFPHELPYLVTPTPRVTR